MRMTRDTYTSGTYGPRWHKRAICDECCRGFSTTRCDARLCSPLCRKRRQRRKRAEDQQRQLDDAGAVKAAVALGEVEPAATNSGTRRLGKDTAKIGGSTDGKAKIRRKAQQTESATRPGCKPVRERVQQGPPQLDADGEVPKSERKTGQGRAAKGKRAGRHGKPCKKASR